MANRAFVHCSGRQTLRGLDDPPQAANQELQSIDVTVDGKMVSQGLMRQG